MGRIHRDKGILDLAESFASIAACRPEAMLLMVGPEEEPILEDVRRTCASFSDRLKTVGYTRNPERYMAASDVLCSAQLPGKDIGLVIIEAAACAVPTVASPDLWSDGCGGRRDHGLLHEPRNPRDLTEKLLILLNDSSLRRTMGAAGRERALRLFSQERLTGAMVDLYRQLLETHPARRCALTLGRVAGGENIVNRAETLTDRNVLVTAPGGRAPCGPRAASCRMPDSCSFG